jgi:hypothetical protein
MFRDSQTWARNEIGQVDHFFSQIRNQETETSLSIFCLEGNSKDDTFDSIKKYAFADDAPPVCCIQEESTYGEIQSKVKYARFKELARLGTLLLQKSLQVHSDYTLWIESDLIISNNLISSLIESAQTLKASIVAPVVYLQNKKQFYDIWAFRDTEGKHFRSNFNSDPPRQIQMASIGSCALIESKYIADGCNFGEGAFPSLCEAVRHKGGTVFCDTKIKIEHPSSQYIKGRWI